MSDMTTIIIEFVLSILSSSPLMVGLTTAFGYMLLRKPWKTVLSGFIKGAVGIYLLWLGAGAVVEVAMPIGDLTEIGLGLRGVLMSFNEDFVAIASAYIGEAIGPIIIGSFLINLAIARVTPFKYINLNVDNIFTSSGIGLVYYMMGFDMTTIILLTSITVAIMSAVFPAFARPFMDKVTKNSGMQMGHAGTVGYALSASIGGLFGDPEQDVEKMKIPDSISWLKDIVVSTTIVMTIMLVCFSLAAGLDLVFTDFAGGTPLHVWFITQAMWFAAGISAILLGVRMMTTEIVPSFKGISDKVVPRAMVALDCPVIYPFAPMGLLIGFMFSIVGYLVALVIFLMFGGDLFPLILFHSGLAFFLGANTGIFGNAAGGYKGAIIGPIIEALIRYISASILCPWLGPLAMVITYGGSEEIMVTMFLLGIYNMSIGVSFGMILLAIPIIYWIAAYFFIVEVMAKRLKRIPDKFLVR